MHRPADVPELQRPEILDRLIDAAADQIHDGGRHQHTADRRMILQARHDVDGVAQQVGAFHRHLAHMDGAAQLQAEVAFGGHLADRSLNRQRRPGGVDRAGELDQQSIAQRLEDTAAAAGDQGIDLATQHTPRHKGVVLVGLDEGAEAHHIERGHDHEPAGRKVLVGALR